MPGRQQRGNQALLRMRKTEVRRQAQVIGVDENLVHLNVQRAGCERCEQGRGCGAGLMTRLLSPQQFQLSVPRVAVTEMAAGSLVAGDQVWIMGSDRVLAQLALRLYAIPCVAFMLALMLVHFGFASVPAGWRDALSLLAGIGALLLSWRWTAPMSRAVPLWQDLRIEPLDADARAMGQTSVLVPPEG